jgi:GNAT superfamily N-acetyltransferase
VSEPQLRSAVAADIPALERLIERSGIELSAGFYTEAQAAAVTRHVFGVDTQLVDDGSYYLIVHDDVIVACGGWSARRTLYGADRTKTGPDPGLDPSTEPARIRAFFVDPTMARRGFGRRLLAHCTAAAAAAGFRSLELAATMPGVPLYLASGFSIVEEFTITLPGNVNVPLARMRREIGKS